MRRHRFLAGATSAVAATIVLAALLYTPRGAVVEASTIFNSLRQTLFDGFQITLEEVGHDGIRVDGLVRIAFKPPDGADDQTSDEFDPDALLAESVYVDLHVQAEDSNEDLAGLDVAMICALSEQTQWVYLKTLGLPDELLEEEPMAWMLVSMTNSGVLLELDGLVDDWNQVEHANLDAGAGGEADARAAVNVSVGDDPDGISISGMNFQPEWSLGDDGEMDQLLWDFITGRATGEQIDELYSLIAEAARDVSVREEQPGLHVLTARDFKLDEMDAEEVAMVGNMVLEIVYREGSGIQSAALENIGQYAGTLRLEPLDDQTGEDLFDRERVIEPGVTKVWDLSSLVPILKQSIEHDD